MNKLFKFHARPKLNTPNMVAAWPGIGNVSIIVATYLKRKLDFKELGEIEASQFFDPIGVVVKNNIVEAPQFPQSQFYYRKNKGGGSDTILFIGEDQPAGKAYDLANCILDVGLKFQVRRVYTCAAALTHIHPTEQPRVWGVASSPHLMDELKEHDLAQRGNLHISGLNGLLLGVAKERGIEGICLLGEVPMYATRIHNPMAALAIVEVLTKILGVSLDTLELALQAGETSAKMKQLAAEAMEEYIDLFTEPIWEQGEEEEEE
ncbi:MAG: PAC2 family protein [Dehalococcoidales bacterium]|nr:PAC2 family protein [Dehalococcoidales bacterium]MDZ4231005.1 PAC2 family protein [Dehalococcoidales bacterium]